MTYDLAKKLKDAGFPQMGYGFELMLHDPKLAEDAGDQTMDRIERSKYVMLGKYDVFGEDVYEPTLTELIEACGNNFEALTMQHSHAGNTWHAISFHSFRAHGHGSTPEEAVANLWLESQP